MHRRDEVREAAGVELAGAIAGAHGAAEAREIGAERGETGQFGGTQGTSQTDERRPGAVHGGHEGGERLGADTVDQAAAATAGKPSTAARAASDGSRPASAMNTGTTA